MRMGSVMKSGWFCIALCCLLSAFFPLGAEEAVHWDRENLKVSWKKKISVSADSGGGVTAEFRTGSNPWPYFVLVPEKGKNWDFSRFRFISFAIENLDRERAVTGDICLGMWSRHKIGVFVLGPGEKRSFTYPLNHGGRSSFDPLFRAKGMPNGFEGGTNIDTSSVKCIHVICGFVRYGRFRISGIRLHGRYDPSPAIRSPETFFPFIDDYGQYCHEEWPEKIKSNRQLKESLRNEKSALKPRVADWDPWGGWKSGPRLKATGYFRVEKWEGKWYFADPDGRLFFSRGVNAWSRGEYWPTDRGKAKCYTRKSAAPGRVFHFYSDNCRIRYGNESWHDFQFRRMESWGYNTIGNWSDPALYRKRKMPYMLNLPLPSRKAMRFGPKNEFRDVYSPEFESELLNVLPEKFRWTIEDPYCIGYFVGNELHFGSSVEVAEAAFLASAELPAKRELIAGLRKKYGTIAALNKAWKGSWPSWDALACVETLPDAKGCRADFEAFSLKFWKRFFELSRQAVKKHAPHHLYLGSRFKVQDYNKQWLFRMASESCDVVSINDYALHHDHSVYAGLGDKPVLISESSVGHRMRGMPGILAYPGCAPHVREEAQKILLESTARHPLIVGIHHFCFKDQTLIGRWDGENYGIGLVSVTDEPYRAFVESNRAFSERLYPFRRNAEPVRIPR